jgi:wyosine [tRNA(Phe)-imidazoG37] synthetase (radical SAM superfamily)
MTVFGPIPSRRLGRSLGINTLDKKACTYGCVYCQTGKTELYLNDRIPFEDPDNVFKEVKRKIEKVRKLGESIDYLTFAPGGEPTLDINLGLIIDKVKVFNIPVAVITNATLMTRQDVRSDLSKANLVSVKVDSVIEESWRKINNPHEKLKLKSILESIIEFSNSYNGELLTETMLVAGVNDNTDHASKLSEYLLKVKPDNSFISVPTRPPAEKWVKAPSEEIVNIFYQVIFRKIEKVALLIHSEGSNFTSTGDESEDLLNIVAVHPMREDTVRQFLVKSRKNWDLVKDLIAEGKIVRVNYGESYFYMKSIKKDI